MILKNSYKFLLTNGIFFHGMNWQRRGVSHIPQPVRGDPGQ